MAQSIDGQAADSEQKTQDALDKAEQAEKSASDEVDKNVAQLQQADLRQKMAKSVADAAADANKELNSSLSSMLQPVYDAIREFKTVPDKLRKLVDTEGAKNGMYDQMGKVGVSVDKIKSNMVSA